MASQADKAAQRKKRPTLVAQQRAFLAAYRDTGNISEAATIAGIARRRHYEWIDSDPTYADDFAQAGEDAADRLEREALRRAVEGVDEPVWFKGEQVGAVRKYSDTLLIFLLKGVRPEKFRDRVDHRHSGEIRNPSAEDALRSLLADPDRLAQAEALLDGAG